MAPNGKKASPQKKAGTKKKAAGKKKAAPAKKKSAPKKTTSASSTSPFLPDATLTAKQKVDLKRVIQTDVTQVFSVEAGIRLDDSGQPSAVELFNELLVKTLEDAVDKNQIKVWGDAEKAYVYPHIRAIACRAASVAKSANHARISRADLSGVADPWIKEAKGKAKAKLARLRRLKTSTKAGSVARIRAQAVEDYFEIKTKYCDGYS